MANILIVYGSTTGNRCSVAKNIEQILFEQGNTFDAIGVSAVNAKGLCENYDLVLVGYSTCGDEEIEL